MADSLDFPDSPFIGQEWEINGFIYYWTGSTWDTNPLIREYTRETMYCSIDDDFEEIGTPTTAPDYWVESSTEASLWRAEREFNGQTQLWSEWRVSALKGRDGYTYFTSTVYARSVETPSTPVGGSFEEPVPTGWSLTVPVGDTPLWATTRIFMADPTPSVLYEPLEGPETDAWTTPVQLTDIGYPEILSSPLEAPGSPEDSPGDWAILGTEEEPVVWLAIRVTRNGTSSDWSITKVLGTDGVDGIDGVDGESARGVKLTVDTQAFLYTSAGGAPSPATTNVYATSQNTVGDVYYEFYENGALVAGPSTNATYVHTASSLYEDMPVKLEVRIREGSASNPVVAVDQFTLFGIRPSNEVIYVDVSTLSAVVSANAEGIPKSFANTGVEFNVWIGGVKAAYATSGANTYSISSVATGCTLGTPVTLAGVTRKYANLTAMSDESATAVFTVTVRDANETVSVYERTQTFTKSRDGGTGTGIDSRTVSLSTTTQAFEYDSAGGSPSPATATITATALATTGTPYYEFVIDGVSVANTTNNTYTYTAKSLFVEMPDSVKVNLREGSNSGTIVASDIMTLFGLRENSDGITISLSNEAHVIPSNSSGTPTSYVGSGTSIQVWRGTTPLEYGESGANTFSVSAQGFDITPGTPTNFNTLTRMYGVASAMLANIASIVFTITVRDAQGNGITFNKTQSFSKSTDGQDGTSSNMPFVSVCFIRAASKPAQPTGGSWTSPLPTNAGWSDGIPSGTLQIWQTSRTFTSDGLSPQSATWSDPSAISNTQLQEYMWSAVPVSPGNPTDNPGNWTADPDISTIWQAMRQIVNGVAQAWVIIRVKGEDGINGLDGADGADGSDGVHARAVKLVADFQAFTYNSAGFSPTPPTANISAEAVNTTGTVYFEFFLDDVSVQNSTTSTYTYTPQSNNENMPQKIEVQIREASDVGPILARDQLTVFGVLPGTNAITIVLSNEAHTLPTSNTGVVTYTDSGTKIYVYEGSNELNYDGIGTSIGTWKISTLPVNIVVGGLTDSGNHLTVGNHSNMSADNAQITYTVSGTRIDGTPFSFDRTQSLSKSKQGNNGTDGTGSSRGFNFFKAANSDGAWDDVLASAIVSGGVPVTNDVVTIYKATDVSINVTKFWNGSSWELPADGGLFLGSIIVDGSIIGRHIAASISMTTPRLNGGVLNGGTVQLIGSNYMSVQSHTPFGPDNLLEWRGPRLTTGTGDDENPNYAALTKANALSWFDTNGNQYYGGSLSAGTLKTSVQNTTKVEYNVGEVVATIGPFTTNGNTKTVVVSHSMSANSESVGGTCPINPTVATCGWKLERKIGTGAWTQVAIGTSTGNFHCEDGEGSALVSENMGSSVTFTDSTATVADFNYRVVITAYVRYSATSNVSAQQVSIICTEE